MQTALSGGGSLPFSSPFFAFKSPNAYDEWWEDEGSSTKVEK